MANSVAIRGSMGADRNSGYEYITGTGSLEAFAKPSATSRDQATIHTVRITIPTDRRISIDWKEEGKAWVTLIDQYACNLTCPEEIRFGFTAGTGASYANQEVRNLSVTNIPEPTTALLLIPGLGGVLALRRRMRGVLGRMAVAPQGGLPAQAVARSVRPTACFDLASIEKIQRRFAKWGGALATDFHPGGDNEQNSCADGSG